MAQMRALAPVLALVMALMSALALALALALARVQPAGSGATPGGARARGAGYGRSCLTRCLATVRYGGCSAEGAVRRARCGGR